MASDGKDVEVLLESHEGHRSRVPVQMVLEQVAVHAYHVTADMDLVALLDTKARNCCRAYMFVAETSAPCSSSAVKAWIESFSRQASCQRRDLLVHQRPNFPKHLRYHRDFRLCPYNLLLPFRWHRLKALTPHGT